MLQELSAVKASLEQTLASTRNWQKTIDAKRADIATNVAEFAEGAAALRKDGNDFLTQSHSELQAIQEVYTLRINNVSKETCSAVNQVCSSCRRRESCRKSRPPWAFSGLPQISETWESLVGLKWSERTWTGLGE